MRSVTSDDSRAAGTRTPTRGAVLIALAFVAGVVAAGEQPLVGMPPIASFKPDVEYYPQQFAIAQDRDGLVYFAGGDGTLVFDGARWALQRMPGDDTVRSLRWDGAARVYVGGYDAFGWFEHDATGAVVYHDLTPQARALAGADGFADVWELFVLPEGVLFRALNHVFLYQPKSGALRHWQHAGRFGTAFRDADGLVLQFRGEGFKRLVGDRWVPLPGGDAPGFKDLAFYVLPLPGGGWLVNARSGGWLELRDGAVRPATVPRELMAAGRVSAALALPDGTLAIGGDDGTLQVWDPRSAVVHRVRVADEGLSDIVLARDGGLLIAADTAIHRVQWPTEWTAVGAEVGLRGGVHATARWGDRRLILTGAGASELVRDAEDELRAKRLPWTDHEAWDLLTLDAQSALLAESYALYEVARRGADRVDDAKLTKLTHDTLYPRCLVRSRYDPALVYVGTEHGLALLRRSAAGWRLVAEHVDPLGPRVLQVIETAPGVVWLGTERRGALRARLGADGSSVAAVEVFGPAQGLPLGEGGKAVLARLPDGALIASTAEGLFRLDGTRFVADAVGGLAALRRGPVPFDLAVGPDGSAWAWSFDELHRSTPQGGWVSEDIGAIRRGVLEHVDFDSDGEVTVSTTLGVLYHRRANRVADGAAPQAALRGVTLVAADGASQSMVLEGASPLALTQDDERAVEFRFALPELRRAGAARYRARLIGYESEFSDWSVAAQHSYRGLGAGRYRFEVEARDADGAVTATAPFEFAVRPRWYARTWARVLWALLAFAATFAATLGVVGWRTRKLAGDKAQLEAMVEARTRELADANRKLDTMAHLDGLTGIPNRRKLDEYLEHVWQQCAERERPLAVLAIDVDRFKDYNDKHGHLAGDTLLKRLAPILSRNLRRNEDLAARYGGEEFLVVLPGADTEVAREVAEALRAKVAGSSLGTTISIGVAAETPRSGRAVTELVALADAALYRAKRDGRDRVAVSGA